MSKHHLVSLELTAGSSFQWLRQIRRACLQPQKKNGIFVFIYFSTEISTLVALEIRLGMARTRKLGRS